MDMLSMFIVIYVHVYVCKDCFQICDMLVQDIRKAINWIELNWILDQNFVLLFLSPPTYAQRNLSFIILGDAYK